MRGIIFLGIFIIFLSFYACEKDTEVKPKEYPFVITNDPKVSEEGAGFSADLANIGNQEILKYGFVWGREPYPTIQGQNKLFDGKAEKGTYSLNVTGGLEKEQTYYVRAYILTDQYEVYGNEKSFDSRGSLAPVITDFTPKYGSIGTEVIIEGDNYALSKTENIVKFGNTEAIIDSVSENQLRITIPKITKPEKVQISIETAGMQTTSDDFFDLWFPWLQKADFNSVGYNSASFSIEDTGYVINKNSTTMLTYNPAEDKWQNNIILPENSGNIPLAFSSNETAYVLLKDNFWEYNPLSNNWVKKENFPGILQDDRRYIFGLNIGSNIYIGNCYKNYDFWEYNPDQDSWQRKADFIGNFSQSVWGNYSFSLNNKGFFGVSQTGFALNTLWEYDPIQDSWSGKSPLPSDAYGLYCSFVINENAFVGLGNNFEWGDGYVSNRLWRYDFQNDEWVRYHDCPVNMAVYTSFSINGKGYIISGFTKYSRDLHNVWEFDPAKN